MAEPNEIELVFEPQEEGGYHVYAPELRFSASRMSPRQPVVSGAELIRALERDGWRVVRQRGSHFA